MQSSPEARSTKLRLTIFVNLLRVDYPLQILAATSDHPVVSYIEVRAPLQKMRVQFSLQALTEEGQRTHLPGWPNGKASGLRPEHTPIGGRSRAGNPLD